jgi:hypothetical protein
MFVTALPGCSQKLTRPRAAELISKNKDFNDAIKINVPVGNFFFDYRNIDNYYTDLDLPFAALQQSGILSRSESGQHLGWWESEYITVLTPLGKAATRSMPSIPMNSVGQHAVSVSLAIRSNLWYTLWYLRAELRPKSLESLALPAGKNAGPSSHGSGIHYSTRSIFQVVSITEKRPATRHSGYTMMDGDWWRSKYRVASGAGGPGLSDPSQPG